MLNLIVHAWRGTQRREAITRALLEDLRKATEAHDIMEVPEADLMASIERRACALCEAATADGYAIAWRSVAKAAVNRRIQDWMWIY